MWRVLHVTHEHGIPCFWKLLTAGQLPDPHRYTEIRDGDIRVADMALWCLSTPLMLPGNLYSKHPQLLFRLFNKLQHLFQESVQFPWGNLWVYVYFKLRILWPSLVADWLCDHPTHYSEQFNSKSSISYTLLYKMAVLEPLRGQLLPIPHAANKIEKHCYWKSGMSLCVMWTLTLE